MADLCVSVSHSDRALAVAVSRHRIGIDIEDLRSLPKRPITLLFSDEECDTIVDDVSFTKAWVRKEAYAKWLGTGLRDSLAEGVYDTKTHVTEWTGKNDRSLDEKLYIGLAGTDCPSAVIIGITLETHLGLK
jgi:phosphopantetheinyl transferase